MSTNTFGKRVREERKALKLSQADLAEEIGISRNYLSQIERGEATNLSWQVKQSLAQKLGILLSEQNENSRLDNLPEGLGEFAQQEGLQPDDISMLSRLEYRGQKPTTAEQWKLLYRVIRSVIVDE